MQQYVMLTAKVYLPVYRRKKFHSPVSLEERKIKLHYIHQTSKSRNTSLVILVGVALTKQVAVNKGVNDEGS
jgi:hypothetical protein